MSSDKQPRDNIVRLEVVNDGVEVRNEAATKLVVAFLRAWADGIEQGDEKAERAVLLLYHREQGEAFHVVSKRCNIDFLSQVGLMKLALHDVCNGGASDDEDGPNVA
jgi:hypothetical protein